MFMSAARERNGRARVMALSTNTGVERATVQPLSTFSSARPVTEVSIARRLDIQTSFLRFVHKCEQTQSSANAAAAAARLTRGTDEETKRRKEEEKKKAEEKKKVKEEEEKKKAEKRKKTTDERKKKEETERKKAAAALAKKKAAQESEKKRKSEEEKARKKEFEADVERKKASAQTSMKGKLRSRKHDEVLEDLESGEPQTKKEKGEDASELVKALMGRLESESKGRREAEAKLAMVRL